MKIADRAARRAYRRFEELHREALAEVLGPGRRPGGERGPATAQLLGSSTGHISSQDAEASTGLYVRVAVGGSCSQLRAIGYRQQKPPQGTRGEVLTFTRKSRARMLQTCASIPREQVAKGMLFVTLTYPAEYTFDSAEWKRDLDVFGHRLRRAFPRAGCVWKLEPQARGAPHFHLIVVGVPHMAWQWVRDAWHGVLWGDRQCACSWAKPNKPDCGCETAITNSRAAGSQVQGVKSHAGVLAYAVKYASKGLGQLPAHWQNGVGRWWGVIGRVELGIVQEWAMLTAPQFHQLRRHYAETIKRRQHAHVLRSGPARASPGREQWNMQRKYSGMWLMLSDQVAGQLVQLVGGELGGRGQQKARRLELEQSFACETPTSLTLARVRAAREESTCPKGVSVPRACEGAKQTGLLDRLTRPEAGDLAQYLAELPW